MLGMNTVFDLINAHVPISAHRILYWLFTLARVRQSVTSLTAHPGVMSLITSRSHIIVEIDHEVFSLAILLFPLIQEGLLSVTIESMLTKYWLTA